MTMLGVFRLLGAAVGLFGIIILIAQATSGFFDEEHDSDEREIFPLER